jgi:hypothetical protein
MAVNYNTLFDRLGKYVKYVNEWIANQRSIVLGTDEMADDILDEFNDRRDLVTGLQSRAEGMATTMGSWASQLKAYCDLLIRDLQDELQVSTTNVSRIIDALIVDMVANAEDVLENNISALSITPDGGNVGDGVVIGSILNVDGVDDERIIDENVQFTCTGDRHLGASAGAERFSIVGTPRPRSMEGDPDDVSNGPKRGNGNGPSMRLIDSANLLLNGGFDTFSVADTPDSWDLDAGAAATHYFEETTVIVTAWGGSALKILATASPANLILSQDMTKLRPNTTYCGVVRLIKSGTMGAGSTFEVKMVGTGVSDEELFDADPNTLTTSYAAHSAFFTTPADIPDNYRMEIRWTGASGQSGESVWVDGCVVGIPVEFGHVQYAIYRGLNTDFIIDDFIDVVTANDYQGVFQTFMGYVYDKQLPSTTAGPSQADSKAT